MAKTNANGIDLNGPRGHIALEAIWQIAPIFDALLERTKLLGGDNMDDAAIMMALELRGAALTGAAMSALGDGCGISLPQLQAVIDADAYPKTENTEATSD
jgi:hypothetical protein